MNPFKDEIYTFILAGVWKIITLICSVLIGLIGIMLLIIAIRDLFGAF